MRARLLDREHEADDVEDAVQRLLESGALNDARVAAAYVSSALRIKGRGRLRIQRELREIGIPADVATQALADAFGDLDERSLIRKALHKKLRAGQKTIATRQEYARVFQFLVRQGFSAAVITNVLRAYRKGQETDE